MTKVNRTVLSNEVPTVHEFDAGGVVRAVNDWFMYQGKLYKYLLSTPHTVPLGSTPETDGGVHSSINPNGAWMLLSGAGDTSLRQELVSTAGASMVGTQSGTTVQRYLDNLPNQYEVVGTTDNAIAAHNLDINAHPEMRQDVQELVDAARVAASSAESARDAAAAAGRVYTLPEYGQADPALPVGQYFWVVSSNNNNVLELWQKKESAPTDTGKRTPSTVVIQGLMNSLSASMYLDASNNKTLYSTIVDESASPTDFNLFIKLTKAIRLRYMNQVVAATWDAIKLDIGDNSLFSTNRYGITDCLKLNDQSLVYDLILKKFKVVSSPSINPSNEVVVALGYYGQLVGGVMLDWYSKCEIESAYVNSESRVYFNMGNTDSSIPVVEQAGVSDFGYRMYLKFNEDLRLKLPHTLVMANWAKIKTDINDSTKFGISYTGVPDCLILKDEALVYNRLDGKFKVVPRDDGKLSWYVLLAHSVYGQFTDGLVHDWWVSKNVGKGTGTTVTNSTRLSKGKNNLIAHGGMSNVNYLAPFDTLPAYAFAGEYQYYGFETDAVPTKDNGWVLCHDEVLDNYTNGTGNIIDYTVAELKLLDASKLAVQSGWKLTPLPTLDEFMRVCVQYNGRPFIEIKPSTITDAQARSFVSTVSSRMNLAECTVISFHEGVLRKLRSLSTELHLGLLTFAVQPSHVSVAKSIGNCMLDVQSTSNLDTVKAAQAEGIQVGVWSLSQTELDSGTYDVYDFCTVDASIRPNVDVSSVLHRTSSWSFTEDAGTYFADSNSTVFPSGKYMYIDVPAKLLNAVLFSMEVSSGSAISLSMYELDSSEALLREMGSWVYSSSTLVPRTAQAVVQNRNTSTVRIQVQRSGSTVRTRNVNARVCSVGSL